MQFFMLMFHHYYFSTSLLSFNLFIVMMTENKTSICQIRIVFQIAFLHRNLMLPYDRTVGHFENQHVNTNFQGHTFQGTKFVCAIISGVWQYQVQCQSHSVLQPKTSLQDESFARRSKNYIMYQIFKASWGGVSLTSPIRLRQSRTTPEKAFRHALKCWRSPTGEVRP